MAVLRHGLHCQRSSGGSEHYKDGGSASVIPELSLWAACVIVRHLQSSVSPMQLWVTFQ